MTVVCWSRVVRAVCIVIAATSTSTSTSSTVVALVLLGEIEVLWTVW